MTKIASLWFIDDVSIINGTVFNPGYVANTYRDYRI